MPSTDVTRAIDDAIEAQRRRRARRGLTPRIFPLQALTELLEDDIALMRRAGRSDSLICEIIENATGRRIRPVQLGAGEAPPRRQASGPRPALRLVKGA